jgi:hypothetical protein
MKKLIIASLLVAVTAPAFAQKYMTRTGKISFNATSPKSPEKIEAVNNEVATILDSKTGDFVFQAPIKSFKFERDLMQQHFNENYMESDKFPKAQFKGKIANMNEVNLTKDGTYKASVTGELTIHGVTKTVTVPGTVTVKGGNATASAKFTIHLADYKVEVPSVVSDKVAKDAVIVVDAAMAQK